MGKDSHFRMLIVDDNESIHSDLRKILDPRKLDDSFIADEALLFGTTTTPGITFEIDSAFQGKDAFNMVQAAHAAGRPYALAFVDIRMPPGWDGVETIKNLWRIDPDLQVVICTAYSDYNWTGIVQNLGVSENFVVLKKPFDPIEASQLAHALTAKWVSMSGARMRVEELDSLVAKRTKELVSANVQLTLLGEALKAAADSIAITDLKGNFVWTNPAFSKQSGYSAEEVIGKNRSLLKSGKQSADFYREMWATIRSGSMWRGEIVNRRKDGSCSIEEMTITPVSLESTGLNGDSITHGSNTHRNTHFVAINRDITERKKAEDAVRSAEQKYRAMFEDAVIGMFQASPKGDLVKVNRAFAQMHGYATPEHMMEEIVGMPSKLLVKPRQIEEWCTGLNENGVIRGAEVQIMRRDFSYKWVMVNIRAVRDAAGALVLHEGTVEDITIRKLAQEQVNFLAYYDHLTGLPNRTLLHDRLTQALAEARRRVNKVAVLFMDLDRFKIINDSLGHSFGDLLLQQVADRLKKETREQDTVSRVGGDEFIVVLTGTENLTEIAHAAERIVNGITGEYKIQGRTLSISCSLGISIFPEHGEDGETLIKNADAAMYCAKEDGSNNWRFFTDEMNAQVVERMNLETSLRLAVDRQELFLEYQPQVEIETGNVTGLEALIRWQHPDSGLMAPDRFIRIAEKSGLIASIGKWVLRTACIQARRWLNEGLLPGPVAVNVSAIQFRSEGFCQFIREVLEETGLDARHLELELTESLLLTNADVMFTALQELKKMGLKLVIDDFGTGYSSLSYLRQFPVSKLKIDQTFIRDVAVNPDDAAITAAIINMAKGLNIKVIAEGVENEAQLTFLRDHQCDEVQGYYFSHPLSVEEVTQKVLITLA